MIEQDDQELGDQYGLYAARPRPRHGAKVWDQLKDQRFHLDELHLDARSRQAPNVDLSRVWFLLQQHVPTLHHPPRQLTVRHLKVRQLRHRHCDTRTKLPPNPDLRDASPLRLALRGDAALLEQPSRHRDQRSKHHDQNALFQLRLLQPISKHVCRVGHRIPL